jgi:hypothetical protein
MTKVLVTSYPSLFDVVQLEPTLEAIYYTYEDCELTLRTLGGYQPFFEHHPLISNVIFFDKDQAPEGFDVIIDIPDIRDWTIKLPTVEKYAAAIGVQLLRKTPKIFLDTYPKDGDRIVLCRVEHELEEWPIFTETLHPAYETTDIGVVDDTDHLRKILSLLASATLVVGPDSWATHAAAALDARVIMVMDPKDESDRAPFHTTVSPGTKDSVLKAVNEVLFEKRYPAALNQGNASDWIKSKAKLYMKSGFADVGCSAWPIPNGIPIDVQNRHIIDSAPDGHFSGVFSSHCLEHIAEWQQELRLWHRVTRTGGCIFMYLPHPRAEVWQAFTGSWVGAQHVWNPEPVQIVQFLKEELGMNVIEYTSRRDALWSFHVIARKI